MSANQSNAGAGTNHPNPPTNPGANATTTANPPVPQQNQMPQQTQTSQTSQTNSNLPPQPIPWPSDLPLAERFISDPHWPPKLRLDLDSCNWEEWSHRMSLVARRQGFHFWLEGIFSQPDLTVDATWHYTWKSNDVSLHAFILDTITCAECKLMQHLPTTSAVWKLLRECHEKRGTFTQLMLIKQALKIRFTSATPLNETIDKIEDLIMHISNMGDLDWPKFKTIILINALGGELEHIQEQVHAMADDPGFSANTVIHRIRQKHDLMKHRAIQGEGLSTLISVLKRQERNDRTITTCSHCQRTGHTAKFCISPGGKYAGHTLEEARLAQRAAWVKERTQNTNRGNNNSASGNNAKVISANIAVSVDNASRSPSPAPSNVTSTTTNSMLINGVTWVPLAPTADSAQLAIAPFMDANYGYSSYQVEETESQSQGENTESQLASYTSLDWNDFSYHNDPAECSAAYPTTPAYKMASNSPFILDSGASCHVSPQKHDFKTLTPTAPHPITGFGGSCVYSVGVGTVEMRTVNGNKIQLNRVLFVLNATVRLISVFSINNDGNNICHFDANSCSVTDRDGNVLLTGSAWKHRRLYTIDCTAKDSTHNPSLQKDVSALYATITPDLETWHRHLGHCNHRTIIDMARDNVIEGMPIDLSSAPASCDPCILGKQA